MKCPICNLENPAEAETCARCGFSLSLSQVVWPEVPQIEVPRASETLGWPQTPAVEPPAPPPAPPSPAPPPAAPAPSGGPLDALLAAASATPPGQAVAQVVTEAQMAYEHVVRGFQAIRQGRLEQARWEFEQARDLAEDSKLLRLIEKQLQALSETSL